jgi:hypothetical protein
MSTTPPRLPPIFFAAVILGIGANGACAQSPGLDEAVGPNGVVTQSLALTPAQRSAIYNSIMRQPLHASSRGVTAAIGAPVPPSAALSDLPDQTVAGDGQDNFLKYAMVEGDVVVVDPIAMRVVDVIHPGVGP